MSPTIVLLSYHLSRVLTEFIRIAMFEQFSLTCCQHYFHVQCVRIQRGRGRKNERNIGRSCNVLADSYIYIYITT